MTNKELQTILKQYPDDATLTIAMDLYDFRAGKDAHLESSDDLNVDYSKQFNHIEIVAGDLTM